MPTVKVRTFKSGNSEAVRLPKEIAFGTDVELTAVRSGDVLTLYPTRRGTMADLVARLDALPKPAEVEIRDEEILPEPKGL